MAKNSIDAYGASGKTNVLMFEPENLHIVTDKAHPLYDERVNLPIDEGMVLNIKELGVLEPIIVWKDPEKGLTCVVVGRQRVKHTLEANKLLLKEGKTPLLVPGVVKRGSANQMAKYMVSENEIRRPDTPLGRAKKMSDALDRGHDEDDLAVLFGCSVQTVRATLSLLDATQAVREAVESGTITVTQARQLGALPPEDQRAKVAEIELATAGTKGHEKSRRQRQVLGEAKARIKSRKEITKALEDASGEYAEAMLWVLGEAK
ncbi:ParB/RepB/Spo0J family partition protein [Klebsiella michiganensis]|uniref:ParB/RepB/Spo0J family partition protein n=1 Tax=Klebsiella michiganensis TaxID=1134687 RepID=UPI00254C3D20|nr:ParB/RepB/Spo0J family partition protein [Klebsiella michiganensis]MDK8024484.1 ParB/RepB/Spo0J family partition protein [Klebsiella michiganensis]